MTIYLAELNDFCGYGCWGCGETPEEAMTELKKEFREMKQTWKIYNPDFNTFIKAWEYFGGNLRELKTGTHHINDGYENIIIKKEYIK